MSNVTNIVSEFLFYELWIGLLQSGVSPPEQNCVRHDSESNKYVCSFDANESNLIYSVWLRHKPRYLIQVQKYFSYVSFEIIKAVYFKITEFHISEGRGDIYIRN